MGNEAIAFISPLFGETIKLEPPGATNGEGSIFSSNVSGIFSLAR